MSNRDTLLPLSRIVTVANETQETFDLPITAHKVTRVTVADASGFPLGRTRLTLSSVVGGPISDEATSGTFDVVVQRDTQGVLQTLADAEIVTAGVYKSDALNIVGDDNVAYGLKVSGVDATYPHGLALLGVSATLSAYITSAKASPTYVTVTDVSGNGGFFKVQPGSSADLYTSAGPYALSTLAAWTSYASGVPGVMAPAQSTVTLTVQPSQKLDTIEILNFTNTTSNFLINYGIIKSANTLRDQGQYEVT